MPLYEYLCEACQIKFEALKPADERHNAICPQCGKLVKKIMSAVNHTFGWTLSERSHQRFGPKHEYVRDI